MSGYRQFIRSLWRRPAAGAVLRLFLWVGLVWLTGCEPPEPYRPPVVPESEPVASEPAAPPEPPLLQPHEAVRQNAFDHLQRQLDRGLDLDRRDADGRTLLHLAAGDGRLSMVAWLVEQGADVDIEDAAGVRPVQLAADAGHSAVTALLLSVGAFLDEDGVDEAVDTVFDPEPEPAESVEAPEESPPEVVLPEGWEELEFRTWRSAYGQTVEAALLELKADIVTLGSRDGQIRRVPITQLHSEDQIAARRITEQGLLAARGRSLSRAEQERRVANVDVAFGADCLGVLTTLLRESRDEVRIAIYTLTHQAVEQELVRAARRGVDVRVKYDRSQLSLESMQEMVRRLERRGVVMIPVTLRDRFASMHHKFMVVDRRRVFTGSFNFTVSAATRSYENCVVIESVPAAHEFLKEFDGITNR
jgi:hypothetical protein